MNAAAHGVRHGLAVDYRRAASDGSEAVRELIRQEALIDTRTSLRALAEYTRAAPPRAVMVGIGLCTSTRLSAALPLDVLGLLMPAERVRQAYGASTLLVLVADQHALYNRFDPLEVERRAQETVAALSRVRAALGLYRLSLVRASRFHRSRAYREVLAEVGERLPARMHPYVERQVADVAYLDRRYDGIVKVGWGRDSSPRPARTDERSFDALVTACFGHQVGYVYCKPGRALSDRARKAAPYIATSSAHRICLRRDEDPAEKLRAAARWASPETIAGVRRHLRRICYAYQRDIRGLRGPLEDRVASIIEHVCAASHRVAPPSLRALG